jgi:hypothetical protein
VYRKWNRGILLSGVVRQFWRRESPTNLQSTSHSNRLFWFWFNLITNTKTPWNHRSPAKRLKTWPICQHQHKKMREICLRSINDRIFFASQTRFGSEFNLLFLTPRCDWNIRWKMDKVAVMLTSAQCIECNKVKILWKSNNEKANIEAKGKSENFEMDKVSIQIFTQPTISFLSWKR